MAKLLAYFFKIEMIKATLKGAKSTSSLPKRGWMCLQTDWTPLLLGVGWGLNATPMALLSHHSPYDSVGIACQYCPLNNETAMRFVGYVLLASLPSYTDLLWMADKYVWLMEWTHELFVPTYIQADNQQLAPYVSISAISRGKVAEIVW